jgi:hypothetical protein
MPREDRENQNVCVCIFVVKDKSNILIHLPTMEFCNDMK